MTDAAACRKPSTRRWPRFCWGIRRGVIDEYEIVFTLWMKRSCHPFLGLTGSAGFRGTRRRAHAWLLSLRSKTAQHKCLVQCATKTSLLVQQHVRVAGVKPARMRARVEVALVTRPQVDLRGLRRCGFRRSRRLRAGECRRRRSRSASHVRTGCIIPFLKGHSLTGCGKTRWGNAL
jgi:hypothetical protein